MNDVPATALLAAEKAILERVAQSLPVHETLEAVALLADRFLPGCCALMRVHPDGSAFHMLAAPGLAESFRSFYADRSVDPEGDPASLAVRTLQPVVVTGAQNDAAWRASAWAGLLAAQGCASAWAMPVSQEAGQALGVLVLHRRTAAAPADDELALAARLSGIVRIALRRAQLDDALLAQQTELRHALSHLMQAQRLSQTGSFTTDVEADEHVWSEELYRVLEFEPGSKVKFQSFRALIHADDLPGFDAGFRRALAEGTDFDHVFRIVTPKGRAKHLHAVSHFSESTAGHRFVAGSIQDVTASRTAEDALKAREAELDRARSELAHVARAAALSALTASIAHEVNQPLAGIVTNASTCLRMLDAAPSDTGGAKATAQRIIRDANRASEVIRRLRALFAGKPMHKGEVDLNDAVREVLSLMSSELQKRRVALRTQLAADLPVILGDRVQLQQVILNLALNACEALHAIDARAREIFIATSCDARQVVLAVSDTGEGAATEYLEQLFDVFYTTKPDGMGVGLSVSRSIIEAHGGHLRARSNEGPGLTFSICIPATA